MSGRKIFNAKVRRELRNMASALGDRLYKEGYKGVFCMDFLLDTDDGTPYLGEVNPRISGASPLTNLITAHYGGVPLFLFHLLEYLDVDYEINLKRKIQNRWNEYDFWSQLVLKQTFDQGPPLLTHAPRSGVWSMDNHGQITFDRPDLDWTNVIDNDEAYYLRVYREGDYTYKGADLGIIVSRGRMQTEKRELRERAKLWTAAINAEFHGIEPKARSRSLPGPLSFQTVLTGGLRKLRQSPRKRGSCYGSFSEIPMRRTAACAGNDVSQADCWSSDALGGVTTALSQPISRSIASATRSTS